MKSAKINRKEERAGRTLDKTLLTRYQNNTAKVVCPNFGHNAVAHTQNCHAENQRYFLFFCDPGIQFKKLESKHDIKLDI